MKAPSPKAPSIGFTNSSSGAPSIDDVRRVRVDLESELRKGLTRVPRELQVVVPSAWNVRLEADVTMGGIRDMRSGVVDAQRPADIVITGRILMGGLEIRGELP